MVMSVHMHENDASPKRHSEHQHANASLYWCGQKSLIYATPAAGHSITKESVDTSTAKQLSEI